MKNSVRINGLVLPEVLVEAVNTGIWQTPKNNSSWRSIFPKQDIVQPMLYSLKGMEGETSWLAKAGLPYFGCVREGFTPGNIDPTQAILIADLGPDRLVALDYRNAETQPSVIGLTSHKHSCWVLVADNIESFMQRLGLKEEFSK